MEPFIRHGTSVAETAETKLANAIYLLRKIEWAGKVFPHDRGMAETCPYCGGQKGVTGHRRGCLVDAFLRSASSSDSTQ